MRPSAARVGVRVAAVAAAAAVLLAAGFVLLPLPRQLLDRRSLVSARFTDRNGGLLREVLSRSDGRAIPLPPGEAIPPLVRKAFLAAEDRRFERHPGVDPLALVRAAWSNLRARRIVSGASTISQQLARQLVPRRRTFAGKVQEALWALRLTAHLPRERILREYLDRIALGEDVYGIEAAARLYFGRPAAALSVGQAALLAGMAKAPAVYDPVQRPDASRRRMGQVLDRMRRCGSLGDEEVRVARAAPLDLVPPSRVFRAPHLVTQLLRALPGIGLDGASAVETTIDPALQADVEELVRTELAGDRRMSQAAAIVIDNATGEVLAYVGSADFVDPEHGGQNDGVRSLRQPGSALKPFAYGLALSTGYTPATVLSDLEVHLDTPSGQYVPRNYDRRVHGPVRLRAALANSYNVPAVRLADALGPDRILSVLHAAGFESLREDAAHYGVGLVLGNGDVTLREMARAYRGLARGGVLEPLVEIRAARDARGSELEVRRELAPRRFLPQDAVALLTDILSDETARAPAFGLDNALRLPFPVAAKTGTSRAYVDNWTAGFTRERTVAVWAGNFDGAPMQRVSGISGAGPIFARVMERAMRGLAPRPLVDRSRFEHVRICPLSGKRAGSACPSQVEEVFLPGTAPRDPCIMHRWNSAAESGRLGRARQAVLPARQAVLPARQAVLDVGPEFYGWARAEGLDAGPWFDADGPAGAEPSGPGPRVLLPADGDEYLLEPGMPLGAQAIPFRARLPAGTRRIELRTEDGTSLRLDPPFTASIPARPGFHQLEVWLPGGQAPLAVARFTVRGGAP